jgi:hypothetical protein
MMKSEANIPSSSEEDWQLAFKDWQDNSAVVFTLAGLIEQTLMVSGNRALEILSYHWDNEETFSNFQDPNTGESAYHVKYERVAKISTDLSDHLTSICFRNVMLHLLYKAALVTDEVRRVLDSDKEGLAGHDDEI